MSAHAELLQELEEATTEANASTPTPTGNQDKDHEIGQDDFEDPDPSEEAQEEAPAKVSKSVLMAEARSWVESATGLFKLVMSKVYAMRILRPGDKEQYEAIKAHVESFPARQQDEVLREAVSSPENRGVYSRFIELGELTEGLDASKEEIDRIAKPLARCFEKWNMEPKPETALIIAVTLFALPRVLPLFPGLGKIADSLGK